MTKSVICLERLIGQITAPPTVHLQEQSTCVGANELGVGGNNGQEYSGSCVILDSMALHIP